MPNLTSDSKHTASPLMIVGTALIGPAYLLLAALGAMALHVTALDPATPMTTDKCVFSSVNALTLTGFSQSVTLDVYRPGGQQVMFALTLVGTLMSWIIGALAVVRIAGLRISALRIALAAVITELIAISAGLLLLTGSDRSAFSAMFDATAALGNSALSLGPTPGAADWRLFLVLLPLAIVGSLGLAVILDLLHWPSRRALSDFTNVSLSMTAAVYLIALIAIAAVFWLSHSDWSAAWHDADFHPFLLASALAIDARGYGAPIDSIATFPRLLQWMLIPLMIVGGCAGGSAGGLKLTTLTEIFRGARDATRRKIAGPGFGIALIWLGIYAGIVLGSFAILLYTDPQTPGEQLLFNAVSAASNVGLSQSTIITGSSTLLVYSVTMLAGRIAPLLMLWSMVESEVKESLPVG